MSQIAARYCLSFSLCFSRICLLYIDCLGASGSVSTSYFAFVAQFWGFGPLVCLRAFCCLPSCILFCLGCACPFIAQFDDD